jgi:hypothetical protein
MHAQPRMDGVKGQHGLPTRWVHSCWPAASADGLTTCTLQAAPSAMQTFLPQHPTTCFEATCSKSRTAFFAPHPRPARRPPRALHLAAPRSDRLRPKLYSTGIKRLCDPVVAAGGARSIQRRIARRSCMLHSCFFVWAVGLVFKARSCGHC